MVGIAGLTTVMATAGPLLPGDVLYPIQDVSEDLYGEFLFGGLDRANYALDILEHKVDDFDLLIGTRYEVPALIALDKAIDRSTLAFASLEEENSSLVRERFSEQILRIRKIYRRSTGSGRRPFGAAFSGKTEIIAIIKTNRDFLQFVPVNCPREANSGFKRSQYSDKGLINRHGRISPQPWGAALFPTHRPTYHWMFGAII
jgi:hypothetical protein